MKCPKCEVNHPAKLGRDCVCGYRFILNPKVDMISDYKMKILVQKASNMDQNFFTFDHLYFTFMRTYLKPTSCLIPIIIITAVLFGILALANGFMIFELYVCGGVFAVLYIISVLVRPNTKKFKKIYPRAKFLEFFELWDEFYKTEKFISETTMENPPPDWKEQDIYDYGVNSIVIVDDDLTVDYMIKNETHTSNQCLILSENGYPSYLMGIAKDIREKSSEIPVYYFHRYDPNRQRQNEGLDADCWSFLNGKYIDIGLDEKSVNEIKVLKDLKFGKNEVIPLSALPPHFLAQSMSLILAGELVALTDLAILGLNPEIMGVMDFG
ncbi:MAG: hypothetical protein COA79_04035 [Planctomycetota bacterium]|nr:MAG: hypothetical protein COA79_04035 [Planctomycetota bacterium]